MPISDSSSTPFQALIVGGGVAGLEAALALRQLAGDRVAVTLLAPDDEFVYRPMTVREPFSYSVANRYPLATIARDAGAELVSHSFKSLDPAAAVVHTDSGAELSYDALLLAPGARRTDPYPHALTLDDSKLDEQLHGLIEDIEQGYVHKLAFVAPSRMPWPLPMYELALMTAARAYDMNIELSITVATPEDAPLGIFGSAVAEGVRAQLEQHGILTLTSAHCEVPAPGHVSVHPGARELQVDRVIALPELAGPAMTGVPATADGGFIPVDRHCKVHGLERVFAAGDATDFAIKQGGIAAQQADVAAGEIAALAGLQVERRPFHPHVRAILLGTNRPLFLSANVTGGDGATSQISGKALWSPPAKIAARYLAPYLDELDRTATNSGRGTVN